MVYLFLLGWLAARHRLIGMLHFKLRAHCIKGIKGSARLKGVRLSLSTGTRSHMNGSSFLSRPKRRVLLASLVVICVLSGLGIISGSQWGSTTIGNRGNVKIDGVGVYKDQNCNTAIGYLDWGTLEPASAQNITLYIRNEGNHVATLFMATDNWNPTNASNYMSLSWNYDGRMLSPMETTEVTLTLSVSVNVENIVDFSFDVIIGVNG